MQCRLAIRATRATGHAGAWERGESRPRALFPEAGRAILYPAYRQTPSVVLAMRVLFQDGSNSEPVLYRFLKRYFKIPFKIVKFQHLKNRKSRIFLKV